MRDHQSRRLLQTFRCYCSPNSQCGSSAKHHDERYNNDVADQWQLAGPGYKNVDIGCEKTHEHYCAPQLHAAKFASDDIFDQLDLPVCIRERSNEVDRKEDPSVDAVTAQSGPCQKRPGDGERKDAKDPYPAIGADRAIVLSQVIWAFVGRVVWSVQA